MRRPCIEPNCPELVEKGSRCEKHRLPHERKRARRGTTGKWRRIRVRALRRDEWRCQRCGAPYPLQVHHRNHDHTDNRLENLETLCESCHKDEHRAS